jgi:hypothetical protein
MKNIELLQRRLMEGMGYMGVGLATLFYFSTVYLVLKEHWSFFDEVTGDVLFLSFLTAGYLLALALFSAGLRFKMRWAHFVVLLLIMAYAFMTSKYIHPMQGEDKRWENLSANIFAAPPANGAQPQR